MPQPKEPELEAVTTTRVSSGGVSARVIALAVSVALVAVVLIGVSGRRQAAPPTTRDLGTLGAPTALGSDKFAVTAVIAQRHFMGLLEEKSVGQLSGTYRLPFAKPSTVARFELNQLWTTTGGNNYVPIDAWEVPLGGMSPSAPKRSVLLDVAVDGKSAQTDAPRPVRLGYSLVITAESAKTFDFVTIDLRMPTR